MVRLILSLLLVSILLFPGQLIHAQDLDTRRGEITTPVDGEAVRGIVAIQGNTLVDGFLSWELNFGYADDSTGTWFLIEESDEPTEGEVLAEWDTTQITDGIYNVRLTIFLEEGRRSHTIVEAIRVRNYTPIETNTPIPSLTSTPFTVTPRPSSTGTPTQVPTETPIPASPTPLPTNPLEVSEDSFTSSMTRGAAGALALFLLIGLYSTLKKTYRKS
jgi:hypothetical protein